MVHSLAFELDLSVMENKVAISCNLEGGALVNEGVSWTQQFQKIEVTRSSILRFLGVMNEWIDAKEFGTVSRPISNMVCIWGPSSCTTKKTRWNPTVNKQIYGLTCALHRNLPLCWILSLIWKEIIGWSFFWAAFLDRRTSFIVSIQSDCLVVLSSPGFTSP